jgi:hypothetical protein
MPEIMIFKAGKYAQGDFGKERMQKMVDAYDPEKNIEAPVVIGHRFFNDSDESQFAHGWVKSLRMDGAGKVYADIPEFSAEVKRAIAENKLRYISAEIFEFDKIEATQSPYLKAVALLGRDPPAVPTARLPNLFSFISGREVCVDEEQHTATFTRKIGKGELEINKGEEEEMGKIEELEAKIQEKDAQLAAFEKEREELRNAGRKQEAEAYFGKLRDEGKVPPAVFEKIVALDIRLGEAERKELRTLVSEFEIKVDLSGTHLAKKQKTPDGGTLSAKINAFQKEKNLSSFFEAAAALQAQSPELFEEEELV